jgi:hypothetical protein
MKTTYNLIQRETRIGCFLEQLAYQRLPFGRVTLIPSVEKNNDRRAGLDGRQRQHRQARRYDRHQIEKAAAGSLASEFFRPSQATTTICPDIPTPPGPP